MTKHSHITKSFSCFFSVCTLLILGLFNLEMIGYISRNVKKEIKTLLQQFNFVVQIPMYKFSNSYHKREIYMHLTFILDIIINNLAFKSTWKNSLKRAKFLQTKIIKTVSL